MIHKHKTIFMEFCSGHQKVAELIRANVSFEDTTDRIDSAQNGKQKI